MADEIDDIFGAIDGEEEVAESVSEEKKIIEEEDGIIKKGKNDEGKSRTKSTVDGDSDDIDMVEAKETTETTKLYNSIMYAQTTSHLRDQEGASGPKKDTKKKEQEAEKHAAP